MYRNLTLGLVALLASGVFGSESEQGAIPLDGVAAYVNERIITVSDVVEAMGASRVELMRQFRGDELREKLRQSYDEARDLLIERKLILYAFDEAEGQLPDWAVDKRVKEVLKESFGGDQSKLVAALASDGVTMKEWRSSIREKMIVQAMVSEKITSNVHVSSGATRSEYDANKDEYGVPAKAQFHLIVMSYTDGTNASAHAAEVHARAAAGEDFSALAREFSCDPRAADGGDWGEVALTSLRHEVAAAIESTAEGAVSPLVEANGFFYIVRVDKKSPASLLPFEDVEAAIEQALRRKESEKARRQWLDSLREKAYIKVLDTNIF